MNELSKIAAELDFIVARGLVSANAKSDRENFGNSVIEMTGKPFSLLIRRDRGQLFVEIGDTTSGWHNLDYAIEFVSQQNSDAIAEPFKNGSRIAQQLEENWNKLAELFSNEKDIESLRTFSRSKAEQFLVRIFGDKHS